MCVCEKHDKRNEHRTSHTMSARGNVIRECSSAYATCAEVHTQKAATVEHRIKAYFCHIPLTCNIVHFRHAVHTDDDPTVVLCAVPRHFRERVHTVRRHCLLLRHSSCDGGGTARFAHCVECNEHHQEGHRPGDDSNHAPLIASYTRTQRRTTPPPTDSL